MPREANKEKKIVKEKIISLKQEITAIATKNDKQMENAIFAKCNREVAEQQVEAGNAHEEEN